MLRAFKRLLRPGGRIAYTNIFVSPELTASQRRRARRSGPRAVASRSDQCQLLASAGLIDIDMYDLTAEFACTARAWIAGWAANEHELARLETPETFAERQRDRHRQLRAIEQGLLRRALFSATRPRPT